MIERVLEELLVCWKKSSIPVSNTITFLVWLRSFHPSSVRSRDDATGPNLFNSRCHDPTTHLPPYTDPFPSSKEPPHTFTRYHQFSILSQSPINENRRQPPRTHGDYLHFLLTVLYFFFWLFVFERHTVKLLKKKKKKKKKKGGGGGGSGLPARSGTMMGGLFPLALRFWSDSYGNWAGENK